MPPSLSDRAAPVCCLLLLGALALLAGCAGEEPAPDAPDPAPEEDEGDGEERLDLEGLLDPEEDGRDAEEPDDTAAQADQGHIEPGTLLGPGEVVTRVGEVTIAFDLPEAVEGGTVAPPDLPVALELVVDGGAIVVFETVGHTRAGDPFEPARGLPDDLAAWLTDDLPSGIDVTDGPTTIDDGVAVSLTNGDDQRSVPVALWRVEGDPIDSVEGHGPPPGQTQHLWLRRLDGAWVGVATYGEATDRDLAEAVASSLRPAASE